MYLVDTDVIIDVLRGDERARDVLKGLSLRDENLAVSVITVGELHEGAYYSRNSFLELESLQALLDTFAEIIDVSRPVADRFAVVRGSLPRQIRNQLGDLDLLIAATALEQGRILVTGNIRDFRHISGLQIANFREM